MTDQQEVTKLDPDDAHADPQFERMLQEVFEQAEMGPPPVATERAIYHDESAELYVGREFTSVEEFARWFAVQQLGGRPYNAVGYHHTYRPTGQIWAGLQSLTNIYNYYYGLGWRPWGLGPHLWVYSGDGPWRTGVPHIYVGTHPAYDGAGIIDRNQCWLHIEHIADGDEAPFNDAMVQVSAQLLAVVCSRHPNADREIPLRFIRDGGIDNPGQPLGVMYHRDQNPDWVPGAWPKSCPGLQVTHENLDPRLEHIAQQHMPWAWQANGDGDGTDPVPETGSVLAGEGATARRQPSRDGEAVGRLAEGQQHATDAYTDRGEMVAGSPRWYRLAADGSWVHSSGGAYSVVS